jgi:hypothetical protein
MESDYPSLLTAGDGIIGRWQGIFSHFSKPLEILTGLSNGIILKFS